VRSLRSHCQRRLQFFPRACLRACADECVVLSLLAAFQNKDKVTRDYCLRVLVSSENAEMKDAVAEPARLVAARMKKHALNLMPVPLAVIASIVKRSCLTCPAADQCKH
jgi:hypothetical protein